MSDRLLISSVFVPRRTSSEEIYNSILPEMQIAFGSFLVFWGFNIFFFAEFAVFCVTLNNLLKILIKSNGEEIAVVAGVIFYVHVQNLK